MPYRLLVTSTVRPPGYGQLQMSRGLGAVTKNAFRELANLKLALVAGFLGAFGLFLIWATSYFEFFHTAHKITGGFLREIGALIATTVALSAVWEYITKRAFAAEIQDIAQLSQDVRAVGLTRANRDFLHGVDWRKLITRAAEMGAVPQGRGKGVERSIPWLFGGERSCATGHSTAEFALLDVKPRPEKARGGRDVRRCVGRSPCRRRGCAA
jgi:hypothetical protein